MPQVSSLALSATPATPERRPPKVALRCLNEATIAIVIQTQSFGDRPALT